MKIVRPSEPTSVGFQYVAAGDVFEYPVGSGELYMVVEWPTYRRSVNDSIPRRCGAVNLDTGALRWDLRPGMHEVRPIDAQVQLLPSDRKV